MGKIKLAMLMHNHQPCDNFGWIFEDAYKKAYEPFISVLEKYPKVKISMHYSGSLLEWLYLNKPEFVSRLKNLMKQRRIELLAGGFYEPVLSVIPQEDKKGQIKLHYDFLKNHFECIPKGVWLTERVWEPDLSDTFLDLGMEYSVVDENHLRGAGVIQKPISGYYELANGFKIFASDKKLRYMMPFSKVNELVEYFKSLSLRGEDLCMVFADDGEKFGYWPHTHDWIYRKRWLEGVFEFLSKENNFIQTITLSDAVKEYKPNGIISIPPSSYSEMMEWAKGDFNNFFKMYPEANIMRNRMLLVSKMVNQALLNEHLTNKQKTILSCARIELFKAQSGCAYWHGIFGGVYLSHLRSGVYKHLIKAQTFLEKLASKKTVHFMEYDMDDDLKKEFIIGNEFVDLYIKPDTKGSVFELDNKVRYGNMINTIARRQEPYHSKILNSRRINLEDIKNSLKEDKYVNVHDVLGIKGKHLRRFLVYDEDSKTSFVDYFIAGRVGINDFAMSRARNIFRVSKYPYRVNKVEDKDKISIILEKEEDFEFGHKPFNIYIKKEISITKDPEFTVEYTIKNLSKDRLKTIFATEFNWSVMNRQFMRNRDFWRRNTFSIKDEWENVSLKYQFNQYVRLWTIPVYTVNESEQGLDKTYQHLNLLVQMPVCLENDKSTKFSAKILVE